MSQVGITKFDDLIIEKANRFTINGLSQIHGVSVKSKAPVAGSEPVELVYIDAIDPSQLTVNDIILTNIEAERVSIVTKPIADATIVPLLKISTNILPALPSL